MPRESVCLVKFEEYRRKLELLLIQIAIRRVWELFYDTLRRMKITIIFVFGTACPHINLIGDENVSTKFEAKCLEA